jgi:hypothetical protein
MTVNLINWPGDEITGMAKTATLPDETELKSLLKKCLDSAVLTLQTRTNTDTDIDPKRYISNDQFNYYQFTQNPNLKFEYCNEDVDTRNYNNYGPHTIRPPEEKLVAEEIIKEANKAHSWSLMQSNDMTRVHYVSSIASGINYWVEQQQENVRSLFLSKLFASGKLQPLPFEQLLWAIDEKKRQKPDKKIFVFLYNEWLSYLKHIYCDQEKIKTNLNGAIIVGLEEKYYGYNSWWRKAGHSRTTINPWSSAVISEDEIQWNITCQYTYNVQKVPRRLLSYWVVNHRPAITIL